MDLANRDFGAERPNQLWVSDLTYVATWSGFGYVKFVVADRADYDGARDVIRERGPDRRVREGSLRAILFSGREGPVGTAAVPRRGGEARGRNSGAEAP